MARRDGGAWHARRRAAGALAGVVLACLAFPHSSRAAAVDPPLTATRTTGESEEMVVQVVINSEVRGQFFVVASGGEFLMRARDLEALGLGKLAVRIVTVGGEELVALSSIEAVTVAFDEKKLALRLEVDPKLLPRATVDFAAGRNQRVFFPTNASAFFNYEVGYAGGNAGEGHVASAATELGIRTGNFLFLDDSTFQDNGSARRYVRLATSLIHDDRTRLARTVVGDFAAGAGDLSSPVNMGGVSYSRLYRMDPYFVRYPQQSLTGFLNTPSEVDVYIDGQRVRTLRLPAGSFDLRDVTQATGLRNVQLVVRDAYGREQRINAPYYSTDVPLKAGLQEFSYNLGALREMYGIESNEYGPLAFSAFHRFGVTDFLTLGASAEGKSGLYNIGPTASVVLGNAGVLTVTAAASGSKGRTGAAAAANYAYVGTHFNAGLVLRKQSRDYAQLVRTEIEKTDHALAATVGYTDPAIGSLSTGYSRLKSYGGPERQSASMTYARPLFRSRASLSLTVMNTWGAERDTNVFAGLVYNFDANYAASARHERFQGNTIDALQFQKAQPVGEGLGYTLVAERLGSEGRTSTLLEPSFQYNSRWGIVRAAALQQNAGAGSKRSYTFAGAGGIAWAADAFSVGRPVEDAFGVVKVDGVEGVKVSVNGQEIGRTDATGKVLIPTLTSFTDNQISINPGSVPLEISFTESMKVVSPAYRGGSLVEFHAHRLRAVTGTLKIRTQGRIVPAEFFQVSIAVEGKSVTFPTGRGGEFYVEDLVPGLHAARLEGNGQVCDFELVVPRSDEPITDLPEIVCEASSLSLRLSRSLGAE